MSEAKLLKQYLLDHQDIDIVYADEETFFRPDWSPELFEQVQYLGDIVAVRCDLQIDTPSSETIDPVFFHVRVQQASRIVHISKIMSRGGSSAFRFPPADDLAVTTLPKDFVKDISVSIIIPTRDRIDLLKNCIESISTKSVHGQWEIIIVDNGSKEEASRAYFEAVQQDPVQRVRVVAADIPFNWSRLNNIGAGHATGEVLVFLNNDIEVIASDWLTWLSGYAMRPQIGVVGGLLLYEDGTIQHAGIVTGLGGFCDHLYRGLLPEKAQGSFIPPHIVRNVSAVTGACMAVKKDRFLEIGGFDEDFEICGSDVELCLRFLGKGFRNVYAPGARLYHLESQTRSGVVPVSDDVRLAQMFARYVPDGDPYYNPGLTLRKMDGSKKNWFERLHGRWREPKWKRLLRSKKG